MNRTDRLSAILIMLQTRKIIKASEIAERFEISLRTVYRDMKALDEAGVPIGAEAGVGYYLIDGYHLPPVMFTPEEAGSLLIASKLIKSFSDQSVIRNFELASDKIKSVLPETHQQFLGEVDDHIHVFYNEFEKTGDFTNDFITRIQSAISSKKCISLEYYSKYKEEKSCRIVEPIGLCFYGFKWHLIAYCQLRKDYRDFRLDRIQNLTFDTTPVSENIQISISNYLDRIWSKEGLIKVAVTFDKKIESQISNTKHYFGFYEQEDKGGSIEMKFAIHDYSYLGDWLLSLGNMVISVSPVKLQEYLVEKVMSLSKLYC